jgi:hypothetical protein
METLRLVNKSLASEQEHIVLQNVETNAIYEFSQITNDTITNGDIAHSVIQSILQREGHTIDGTVENEQVTLHF